MRSRLRLALEILATRMTDGYFLCRDYIGQGSEWRIEKKDISLARWHFSKDIAPRIFKISNKKN
jgi:hypothetical protein